MNKSGFTLIGILIVVMIIAALGYGSSFFFRGNKNDVSIKQNVEKQLTEINKLNNQNNNLISDSLKDEPSNKKIDSNATSSDWQIYKNEEYRFEFQYPSKFKTKIIKYPGNDNWVGFQISLLPLKDIEDSLETPINFIVRKDESNFDPNTTISPNPINSIKTVIIGPDKEKAKKVLVDFSCDDGPEGEGCGTVKTTYYFLEKYNKLYELTFDQTSKAVTLDEFNKIISTFKFIK
jgi:type II secretory pathway pseudopilin PulG